MALLLHIDTATTYAGVCISKDGQTLATESHAEQRDHARFLQPAIEKILTATGYSLKEIDAVAVTGGPGSYTGIRVGLASAKGICFALNKPLIIINTLAVIANAAKSSIVDVETESIANKKLTNDYIFYPMIDARRMEVFAGMYNYELLELSPTSPVILDQAFIDQLNCHSKVIFCGDGAHKIQPFTLPKNYSISNSQHSVNHMIAIAEKEFSAKNFANLAYAEPIYVKEFYQATTSKANTTTN